MTKASRLFDESGKQRVDQAVREAEQRTSAEIVPVVATASGRYDRPEDLAGLWLSVIGLVVAWLLLPEVENDTGSWGGWSGWYSLAILICVVIAGFAVGAAVATRVAWLRRLLTFRRQMADEVAARAQSVFTAREVFRTKAATGLVIYVSLFERLARIQADRAVTEALGQASLEELASALSKRIAEGDLAGALAATISDAGEQLGKVLPRADDDVDELPDSLVLID